MQNLKVLSIVGSNVDFPTTARCITLSADKGLSFNLSRLLGIYCNFFQ